MEVSAKTGTNIKDFFKDLAIMIVMGNKRVQKEETPKNQPTTQPNQANQNSVHLTSQNHANPEKEKKKKCCG